MNKLPMIEKFFVLILLILALIGIAAIWQWATPRAYPCHMWPIQPTWPHVAKLVNPINARSRAIAGKWILPLPLPETVG